MDRIRCIYPNIHKSYTQIFKRAKALKPEAISNRTTLLKNGSKDMFFGQFSIGQVGQSST